MRLALAVLAIAVGLASMPAAAVDDGTLCTSEKTPADQQLAACGRLIASGRFSGPTLGTLRFWRGVAYNKKGDYARVIADMSEVIRLQPNNVPALNMRGSAYYDSGDYDKAITDFDLAIRQQPSGIIFHNRANAYLGKKDYRRAIADYDEAIRQMPREALAFRNRGHARQALGDLDGAERDISEAVRLAPNSPFALISRGIIWRAKGEFDRAIADYGEAIRLTSGPGGDIPTLTAPGTLLVQAYGFRGLAYEGKGDIDHARADYNAALRVKSPGSGAGEVQATARARLLVLTDEPAPSEPRATTPDTKPSPPSPPPQRLPATTQGRRVALVIGNGAYAEASALPNPANDARAVARTLRDIGFEVTEGIDLDRAGLQDLIRTFLRVSAGARVAVMFYAGHGVQIDGKNYLVPVDAKVDTMRNLIGSMTDMDTILAAVDDQVRTNVLILDACRDNPLAPKTADAAPSRAISVAPGLAAPGTLGAGATLGAGTLIAFATAPGQVALDGDGVNSPFSAALVRHIGTPGLELQQMLTRVRSEVVAATKRKQVPWSNSSLLGEVYLVGEKP